MYSTPYMWYAIDKFKWQSRKHRACRDQLCAHGAFLLRGGMGEFGWQNWREYIQSNNPVAAALLSKMGYNRSERVRVKIEFLRMLVRLQLDPARTELLAAFFETYLKLNPQEEILLHKEIEQMPKEVRVMELMTSWEKKGKKEGLKEGLKEGKIEVARNLLAMGVDLELIKKATGLHEDEIARAERG